MVCRLQKPPFHSQEPRFFLQELFILKTVHSKIDDVDDISIPKQLKALRLVICGRNKSVNFNIFTELRVYEKTFV